MMKSVLIFALLATAAFSAVVPDVNSKLRVHLHVDQPIKTNRIDGIVRNLIHNVINKPEVEYHLHLDELVADDEAIENFDIIDVFKDVVNGFNILTQGIQVAINRAGEGFNRIRGELSKIALPKINFPSLVEPIIQIAKVASNMIPCAQTLKNALPNLMGFARAAAANNAAEAVRQLISMLTYMPDISSKCLNKAFSIPPKVMSKIQCGADIVGLAAVVAQFIVSPANLIGTINGLRSMIELIPVTIADCTGAFK